MSNLTIKQKIILGVVIGGMLIVIGIYGYIALNNNEEELDINSLNESGIEKQEDKQEGNTEKNIEGENSSNLNIRN